MRVKEELFELLGGLFDVGMLFEVVAVEIPDFDGGVSCGEVLARGVPAETLDVLLLVVSLLLEGVFGVIQRVLIKHE